ncbi:uncharacterized protein IUM83_09403 [Phytophthora cinnamomi]|uniref:uncharacterized protein n=1 Tax=Phytophthora cinnamomi TaxID=4785 RepID=UPI00355A755A|nr:hypothetical protein IUM83_09403 [Phytophthora cinnamomi]
MGGEDNADASPVYQSRLRAKKEERAQQRQLERELSRSPGSHNFEINTKAATKSGPESTSPGASSWVNVQRLTVVDSSEDAMKRRERAEARKRVIDYQGSIWDAVSNNELDMVRNYFLVEGADTLLLRRHPDAEQCGRTLLHCAAWHGYQAIIELILAVGCDVDAVDSVASKTTALIEAARAGHVDVCVALLRHGASPRYRDSYGDTAFHWAGRQGHGTVLMQMALEQERSDPGSTPALWVMKNFKGRTVIDIVQTHAFIVPLLQKRLGHSFNRALESAQGKRRSRFPARAAVMGTRKSTLVRANSRPGQLLTDLASQNEPLESTLTALSGVDELGLDVSSFTYRSRAWIRVPAKLEQTWDQIRNLIINLLGFTVSMEGFILSVSSDDQHQHFQKKKNQGWRNLFVKLDDISARLIAFTDQSQYEVCWSLQLVGADISTPVPGEPTYGVDVDTAPYCFYVRETSVVKDCTHYFSAADGSTKKAWVKALTQIARDGPRAPRFAVSQAENEFEFHARVVKFRPHVDGTHAEYLITCSCQVFSKMVARRLMKEWSLWRRFSEFEELYQALKKSMGPQMEGIALVKHKRDAFRGVLGKAFDPEFLEERRVVLDSFVSNVCNIRTAVDFFKHHSDPHLKTFFQFDDSCENVDQSPRKAKESRSRPKGSDEDDGSSHRHHRREHRKKSDDADEKERPNKWDRPKSSKHDPKTKYGSEEAEVRLADPTA